ncbi:hypothetical protein [Nocardia sp. NPDC052566]|uniref:hypothetical protein n=1 Tax=Nocardia sp. NPDC052566 TaxID=3364330 RepID=UPI0037C5541D
MTATYHRTVLFGVATVTGLALTITGCTGRAPSFGSPRDPIPSAAIGSPTVPQPVDLAAAVDLAQRFSAAYGTFSPVNPTAVPGRAWIESWQPLAVDLVAEQAAATFDQLWGWTWDQQTQCHDVTVTGPVTTAPTSFGTVIVRIPAKRYVLRLSAHADEGTWQPVTFTVTVGPRSAASPSGSGLAVYLATMTTN